MARRSSRGSVYNKRSNERVKAAQTSGGSQGGIIPQAHAQSSNPTQNQPAQARTQSTQFDPLSRASQFVQNIGRGAVDTGKSYTTDFYDMAEAAATGREREERSYQDETLAGVFGRGLFEGNLDGAWAEAGRRVTQEPGRVVGEVAAETAIMVGSMGFGAVLKGVKIGATGIRATEGGVRSFQSATGIGGANILDTARLTLRPGTQIKTIGPKTTITKSQRGNKGWKTKEKKTRTMDRLESFGTTIGDKQGQWTKRNFPKVADKFKMGRAVGEGTEIPMVKGGSGLPPSSIDDITDNTFSLLSGKNIAGANIAKTVATPQVKKGSNVFSGMSSAEISAAKKLQDQQFEAGKMADVGDGLWEGVSAPGLGDSLGGSSYALNPNFIGPVRPGVKGVLDLNTPKQIGGLGDNFSNLKTATLNSEDIGTTGRQYFDDETGQMLGPNKQPDLFFGTRTKLKPEEREVADKIVKKYQDKVDADDGIMNASEPIKKVFMKDERGDLDFKGMEEMVGNNPDNISGSPSSVQLDKAYAKKKIQEEVYRVLSKQSSKGVGTKAEAEAIAQAVIKHVQKENVEYKKQLAKETSSVGAYMSRPGMQGPPRPTTSSLTSLGAATPGLDTLQNMLSLNLRSKDISTGIIGIKTRAQDGVDIEAANFMVTRGADDIDALLPKGLFVESDMSGTINSIGQQRLDRFGGRIADKGDGSVADNYSQATKQLINESEGVIAYFDGNAGIGTNLALDTAKKKGIPTISNPGPRELNEWAKLYNISQPTVVGTRGSKVNKNPVGPRGPVQPLIERMKYSLGGLTVGRLEKIVPDVDGAVYGAYGKGDSKKPFDAINKEGFAAGGFDLPEGASTTVGSDMLNDGPVANMYTSAGDVLAARNRRGKLVSELAARSDTEKPLYEFAKDPLENAKKQQLYKDIREAKVGSSKRARTPDADRMELPETLEGYRDLYGMTNSEAADMLFRAGQGGIKMDIYAQLGISQKNLRPFNALWEAGKQGPIKNPARWKKGAVIDGVEMVEGATPTTADGVGQPIFTPTSEAMDIMKSINQQRFIKGDLSIIPETKYTGNVDEGYSGLTKAQIKETVGGKQYRKEESELLTKLDPEKDLDSILGSIRYETSYKSPSVYSMARGDTRVVASNIKRKQGTYESGGFTSINDRSWMTDPTKIKKGTKPKKKEKRTFYNDDLLEVRKNDLLKKQKEDFVRTETEEGIIFQSKKKQPKTVSSIWNMFGKMGQPTGAGDTTRVGGGTIYNRPIGPLKPDSRPFKSGTISYGWGANFGSNAWGKGAGVPAGTKASSTQMKLERNSARVPPNMDFVPRPEIQNFKAGPIPGNAPPVPSGFIGPTIPRKRVYPKEFNAKWASLGYLPRL